MNPLPATSIAPPPLPLGRISQLPYDLQGHILQMACNEIDAALLQDAGISLRGRERIICQRRLQELGANCSAHPPTLECVGEFSRQVLCELYKQLHIGFSSSHQTVTLWNAIRNSAKSQSSLLCKKFSKKPPTPRAVHAIASLIHLRLLELLFAKNQKMKWELLKSCTTPHFQRWTTSLEKRTKNTAVIAPSYLPQTTHSLDAFLMLTGLFGMLEGRMYRWIGGYPLFSPPLSPADLTTSKEKALRYLESLQDEERHDCCLMNLLSVAPLELLALLPSNTAQGLGLAWSARRALHREDVKAPAESLLQQAESAANTLNLKTLSEQEKRTYAAYCLRQLLTVQRWQQEELGKRMQAIIAAFPFPGAEYNLFQKESKIVQHLIWTLFIACRQGRIDVIRTFFQLGGARLVTPIAEGNIKPKESWVSLNFTMFLDAAIEEAASPELFALLLHHIWGQRDLGSLPFVKHLLIAEKTWQIESLARSLVKHAPAVAEWIRNMPITNDKPAARQAQQEFCAAL